MKKLQNMKQRGFAMLEVMLAIVIIALAGFGIYTLFSTSSSSANATGEENVVSQIQNALSQYCASASGTAPANLSSITDMQLLDANMIDNITHTVVTGPFGTITYAQGGVADAKGVGCAYSLALGTVPSNAQAKIISDLGQTGDMVGGSGGKTKFDGTNISDLVTTSPSTYTLYIPKGSYVVAP